MIEPQQGRDGLSIPDGPAQNHANGRGQGDEPLVDDFIVLGLCFAFAEARRQIDRHGFRNEAGAGVKLQDAFPMSRGISGFLEQFALGGVEFLFAGIDAASGEFPEKVGGGVAVLSLQKNARDWSRVVHREHYDGPGMVDEIAAGAHAVGLFDVVGGNPEYRATIYSSGGEDTFFVAAAAGKFTAGGFRHEDNIKLRAASF